MILAMFGLSELVELSWGWAALAGGLLLLLFFIRHERKTQDPIVPVHTFVENREFSLSNLTAMINYSATFAISFLLSIYLQSVLNLTSREAGLMMLIQPIVMAMLSPVAGKLSDRHAPTQIATLGMAITAFGFWGWYWSSICSLSGWSCLSSSSSVSALPSLPHRTTMPSWGPCRSLSTALPPPCSVRSASSGRSSRWPS